jgi:hypothetical protein
MHCSIVSREAASEDSPALQRREQITREAHSALPKAKCSNSGLGTSMAIYRSLSRLIFLVVR